MKFSHNWLQEYFEEKLPSPEEVASLLGKHSFEIEGIEGDILDIDVLPNRAHDCFSYLGIAKELATLLNVEVKKTVADFKVGNFKNSEHITLSVEDSLLVPRAMKRVALGVKVGTSPDWLVKRLNSIGQKSINNIVDITNFVMWETGQPVHAFDMDKLDGDKKIIVIKKAKDGEVITALDGKEYKLDDQVLVINDSSKSLDIAGIKGGNISGIDENTKKVVLSVCNFNYVNIRKTSKRLNLRTDASARFENGITPEKTQEAMNRLSQLVSDIAGGEVAEDILDEYPKNAEEKQIKVSVDQVVRLLGIDIIENDITDIFKRMKFSFENEDGDFTVIIPHERLDLNIKEDLIEEIGRIYGYENIPAIFPSTTFNPPVENNTRFFSSKIREVMVGVGFSEVYNYTFKDKGQVELINPLASDKGFLRDNMLDGIQKALEENLKYFDEVKIFEIGKVIVILKEKFRNIVATL
ncbi:phenylalanine--tRNA ligase subunit beta, partial [Patescibacteria group bacterium]